MIAVGPGAATGVSYTFPTRLKEPQAPHRVGSRLVCGMSSEGTRVFATAGGAGET
jgi:hypothetical protein